MSVYLSRLTSPCPCPLCVGVAGDTKREAERVNTHRTCMYYLPLVHHTHARVRRTKPVQKRTHRAGHRVYGTPPAYSGDGSSLGFGDGLEFCRWVGRQLGRPREEGCHDARNKHQGHVVDGGVCYLFQVRQQHQATEASHQINPLQWTNRAARLLVAMVGELNVLHQHPSVCGMNVGPAKAGDSTIIEADSL